MAAANVHLRGTSANNYRPQADDKDAPASPPSPPASTGDNEPDPAAVGLQNYQQAINRQDAQDETLKGNLIDITKRFQDQLTDLQAKMPKPPDVQPFQPPAKSPNKGFGSTAMILAALSGLLTRTPLTTSLNAMAASMKAKREGDDQAYDKAFKEWEENTNYAFKVSDWQNNQYDSILKQTELGYDNQMNLIKNLAQMTNDQTMLAQANMGGLVSAGQLNLDRQKIGFEMKKYADMMQTVNDNPGIEFAVQMALTGNIQGATRILGSSYGQQGKATYQAFRARLAQEAADRGLNGAQVAALEAQYKGEVTEAQTTGRRAAYIGLSAIEAGSFANLAVEASDKVDRTKYRTLNDVQYAVQRRTASPELRQFDAYNNSLIQAYARAVSPTGAMTVDATNHAREVLSTAFSKGDYRAGVAALDREVQIILQAPVTAREAQFRQIAGLPPAAQQGAQGSQQTQQQQAQVPTISTGAQYRALPSGAVYIDSRDHIKKRKP